MSVTLALSSCGQGLNVLLDGSDDLTTWGYRRAITIGENASGGDLDNYQINIILNAANFSTGFSNALSDGSDLRITQNSTAISYWIESWDQPGESASVWVKVPTIPSGSSTDIYLYYGKSGVATTASFENTFTKETGTSNLAARWHFDEGSGSSVTDSSTNSNTGTISGASWEGSDGGGWYNRSDVGFSSGDSLLFNGTSDFITVANHVSLTLNSMTIEAWIRNDAVSTSQYVIAKWDPPLVMSYALAISTEYILLQTTSDGSNVTLDNLSTNPDKIIDGQWHHIAATFDDTLNTKTLYIDGDNAIASNGWAGPIFSGSADLLIGSDTDFTFLYTGTIDEVSIYNTALSAAEILAHAKRSKYTDPPPTVDVVGAEEPL